MAAACVLSGGGGMLKLAPVTFVTGNAKKLEEVKVILGQSIPFQSLKLDCMYIFIFIFISFNYHQIYIFYLLIY